MPTSDANWTYDAVEHKWIPTIDGASEIADLTQVYANEVEIQRELKSMAKTVYNWAYARANAKNRNILEYLFAFDMADVMKSAILAQVEADVSSGINDIKRMHGTNPETGMMMNRKELAQRTICIEAEQILMGATFIVGALEFPLVAQYSLGQSMTATRYTDWGY